MIGAIIGDIVGSIYEFNNIKTKDFPLFSEHGYFSDDTILTCAAADWMINKGSAKEKLLKWGNFYINRTVQAPQTPFGPGFMEWLKTPGNPTKNSFANGCLMRLSPIANLSKTMTEAKEKAEEFTSVTHNHPDSIQAVNAYIDFNFALRNEKNEQDAIAKISEQYGYNLTQTVDQIRPDHKFYISAKRTIPVAIICAAGAISFEDALRNAVSLGGDSDTLACITGGMIQNKYLIPAGIERQAMSYLDNRILYMLAQYSSAKRNQR